MIERHTYRQTAKAVHASRCNSKHIDIYKQGQRSKEEMRGRDHWMALHWNALDSEDSVNYVRNNKLTNKDNNK